MYYPREAERDFKYSVYVCAMFLVVAGLIFATMTFRNGLTYGLLQIDSRVTTGRVLERSESTGPQGESGSTVSISFSFYDRNGVQRLGTAEGFRRLLPYQPGEPIRIAYFPGFSRFYYLEQMVEFIRIDCWIFFAGATATLLGFLLSLWAILDIVQHRQQDRRY